MTGVAIVLTLLVVAFALNGPDRDRSDRAVAHPRTQTAEGPLLGRLRRFRHETSSFVVELPHGALDLSASVRHAAAIEHLAGYVGENRRALARAQR
jgi:hypothetical protein